MRKTNVASVKEKRKCNIKKTQQQKEGRKRVMTTNVAGKTKTKKRE